MPHFDVLKIYNCGKHCNKQYLLFSQWSLSYMALIFHLKCKKMSSVICFNWDQFKILPSGNGLNLTKSCLRLIYQVREKPHVDLGAGGIISAQCLAKYGQ